MNDHFTYHSSLTPDRLSAYAKGELSPEEQHDVELLLEESALHSEAVEGVQSVPGASLRAFKHQRPGSNGSLAPWLAGGGLLLLAGVAAWMLTASSDEPGATQQPSPTRPTLVEQGVAVALPPAEIAAAQELPESLQIGHEPAPQLISTANVIRDVAPDTQPMEHRTIVPDARRDEERHPANEPKSSRQLLFFHNLKLVHPDELYDGDPLLVVDPGGVPADRAGYDPGHDPLTDERAVPYSDFMNEVLGLFADGEHKAALTELRHVLQQYPDDVNAQFYAGLCCYNLGLFDRAKALFLQAAHHRVSTFDEEALWYHALSVERADGPEEAELLFERIAAQNGFYAMKAEEKLQ